MQNKEIEFRGKRIVQKDWVYLDLLEEVEAETIPSDFLQYRIDKSTIGQYIGQKDLHGKKIYDGDFVKVGGLVELVSIIDGMLCSYNVKIYGKRKSISVDDEDDIRVCDSNYFQVYEIIGNIYDNPELIKS